MSFIGNMTIRIWCGMQLFCKEAYLLLCYRYDSAISVTFPVSHGVRRKIPAAGSSSSVHQFNTKNNSVFPSPPKNVYYSSSCCVRCFVHIHLCLPRRGRVSTNLFQQLQLHGQQWEIICYCARVLLQWPHWFKRPILDRKRVGWRNVLRWRIYFPLLLLRKPGWPSKFKFAQLAFRINYIQIRKRRWTTPLITLLATEQSMECFGSTLRAQMWVFKISITCNQS